MKILLEYNYGGNQRGNQLLQLWVLPIIMVPYSQRTAVSPWISVFFCFGKFSLEDDGSLGVTPKWMLSNGKSHL